MTQPNKENLEIYKTKLKELDSVTDAHIKRILINQLKRERLGQSAGQAIGAAAGVLVGIALAPFTAGASLWAVSSFVLGMASVGAAIGGIIDPPKVPDFGDLSGYAGSSPTYGFGALTPTITNQLPVAIIYGHLKVAGNIIWQSDPGTTVQRIQVIGEGEVSGIYDVRVNDLAFGETGAIDKETLILGGHNPAIYYTQHDAISGFVLYGQNNATISTGFYNFDYGQNKVTFPEGLAYPLAVLQGGGSDFKGSYTSASIAGCTYTAYTGTIAQTVDARASDYVNGLKRCAYIAFTLTASDKLKGGNPVTTCMVHGLKIRRWDSSNNIFKTYREYSRNPADCIRDFLTNNMYGVGIPESWIDDTTFGEVAEYCDVLVDDGAGGTEVRFRLDFAIDTRRPALDILNDMFGTFGGYMTVSGEKIKLHVEQAGESAVQSFTMDNIIEGSFGYSQMSKDDLPNRFLVQYVDPDQEWQRIEALAEDKVDQDEREALQLGQHIVERKIALLGITRFTQASRMAKRYLRLAKYSSTMCGIKVGIDSLFCEVGDIINLSHDVPGWSSKPFRILAIQESEKDVMQLVLREYTSDVYDDGFGSAIEKGDYGTVINAFEPVTDVTSLTAAEAGYTDEDGTFISEVQVAWTAPTDGTQVNLLEYIIELNKSGGGYLEVGRAASSATAYTIRPVEGGLNYYVKVKTVSLEGIVSDGTTSAQLSVAGQATPPGTVGSLANTFTNEIILTWAANSEKDVINYEIRTADSNWGTVNNDYVWSGDALTHTIVTPSARSGVTYYVKAKNRTGLYSATAASTAPTNTAPAAPTLSSTVWFGFATLDWTDSSDVDLQHYEVWRSETNAWGGEETLDSKIVGTQAKIYGNATIAVSGTAFDSTTLQDTGLTGTVDDQFNGDVLKQVDGTYSLQEATVTDYASGTQTFTVASWPDGTPTAEDKFVCKDRAYFKVGGVDTFGSGTLSSYKRIDFDPLSFDEIDAVGKITQTEIKDGSITTPKLFANAVTAAKMYAGEVITLSAQIKDAIITNAKINDLDGDKITANSIVVGKLAPNIFGSGQLLDNGNFEDWSNGVDAAPDGWTGGVYGGELYAREASTIKIGTYSVKQTNKIDANGGFHQDVHIEKGIDYWKGRTITLSCWIYCATGDRASLYVTDGVGSAYSAYHTGDSTWQLLTATHTIDGSATRIGIYGLILIGSVIDAYFDGAMLVEGSYAVPFAEKVHSYGHPSDYTKIDGGDIYTGTVTADKITAGTFVGGNFVIGDGGAFKTDNYVADTTGVMLNHEKLELNDVTIMNKGIEYLFGSFQQGFISYGGDGSDGNVTISVNTDISGLTKQYNNLTVNAGVTLTAKNSIIGVKGTLTINGTITATGGGSAGGARRTTDGTGITGTAGDITGCGGSGAGAGYGDDGAGGIDGPGGVGGAAQQAGGAAGAVGNTVTAGYLTAAKAWYRGDFLIGIGKGAGGGSGGFDTDGGGSPYSGAGGDGGGWIYIEARDVVVSATGVITANGGVGEAGDTGGSGNVGVGGGGGGGGGVLVIRYATYTNDGTVETVGGAGGIGGNVGSYTSSSGAIGGAGTVWTINA